MLFSAKGTLCLTSEHFTSDVALTKSHDRSHEGESIEVYRILGRNNALHVEEYARALPPWSRLFF